jgi:hypothetical protein
MLLASLLLLCLAVPATAYDIPAAANMVRLDGVMSITFTTTARPAWAALLVTAPGGNTVRLDCGDLAADRGCFEVGYGDRVLIYGHLRGSAECGYDPPCTEIQVDNIRRYNPSTNVWSLWVYGTGWVPNI